MVEKQFTLVKNLEGLRFGLPPLFSLEATQGRRSIIKVGEVLIGGQELVIIAGPCSVEDEDQIRATAQSVKEAGGTVLRGGAFKPRTSPYSFQGLAEKGLKLMREAADENGLKVVTEASGMNNIEIVAQYTDIIQIGSRNAQNYELIAAAALTGKPILLKRGWDSTIEEWLNAAEYILASGNPNVILCERGIRTPVGTVLDINGIAKVKQLTHLPVIADPSHAAQESKLVHDLSLAAIAAGADGVILEIHEDPVHALSDGKQAINKKVLMEITQNISSVAQIRKRSLMLPSINNALKI